MRHQICTLYPFFSLSRASRRHVNHQTFKSTRVAGRQLVLNAWTSKVRVCWFMTPRVAAGERLVRPCGGKDIPECNSGKKARIFSKMADGPNEFQLEQPPSDGISSVKFSPTSASFLIVSSWDTVSMFFLQFV